MPIIGSMANNGKGRNPYSDATGGTITTFTGDGTRGTVNGAPYRRHVFTSNGTFTVTKNTGTFNFLLVAGGGGSGSSESGFDGSPGSGGGYILRTGQTLSVTGYSIVVGGGGSGGVAGTAGIGQAGGNTTFNSLQGGGGGGGLPQSQSGNNAPGPNAGIPSPEGDGGAGGYGSSTDPLANATATAWGLSSTDGNGGPQKAQPAANGNAGFSGAVSIEYRIG